MLSIVYLYLRRTTSVPITVLFVTFNFAMQISVQKFLDIIIINKYYICRIVCNV